MARRQTYGRPLAPSEHEFMMYLSQGIEAKDMAEMLFITRSSVQARRVSAYGKLGARNAPHAVAQWYAPQLAALERIRKLAAELESSGDMMKMGVAALIRQKMDGYGV